MYKPHSVGFWAGAKVPLHIKLPHPSWLHMKYCFWWQKGSLPALIYRWVCKVSFNALACLGQRKSNPIFPGQKRKQQMACEMPFYSIMEPLAKFRQVCLCVRKETQPAVTAKYHQDKGVQLLWIKGWTGARIISQLKQRVYKYRKFPNSATNFPGLCSSSTLLQNDVNDAHTIETANSTS